MRVLPCLSLAFATLAACSSSSPSSSAPADASLDAPLNDGSAAGCTGIGGTCDPTSAPTCAVSQRDTALCNDVTLVCCLPTGGVIVHPPDSGDVTGDDSSTSRDSGSTEPTVDATMTNPVDASGSKPPTDAGAIEDARAD